MSAVVARAQRDAEVRTIGYHQIRVGPKTVGYHVGYLAEEGHVASYCRVRWSMTPEAARALNAAAR